MKPEHGPWRLAWRGMGAWRWLWLALALAWLALIPLEVMK